MSAPRLGRVPPLRFPGRPGRPRTQVAAGALAAQASAPPAAQPAARVPASPVATVWPLQPRLLGLKEAAAYLGVSTWTIRDWLASGRLVRVMLPGTKGREHLGRPFFDRLDLDELVEIGKAAQ